ncbi:6-phosphogluconolactonase [Edwardsiella hoshinae]|uniref:6-phosphogluconolactonase n=1 Tax=Edwardsiella hoshinae TaxID=93378 RepID=A0A376DH17_9GAMM|nr:6-phosphogluconolactonase [Edwardsiella hoshinae]AOV97219.1 6-phosphogluconolactonase [Edwardsiella hoshinae]QPR26936.1 6-phosphogluconolactonase [Edwardsiella hoshinae]STC89008.1 6-phosphogluconolactonase [Edwardsiella hoshinae]
MVTFNEWNSAQALNEQLAGDIAARLRHGIAVRGQASLVVSGGRTPLGLFAHLREQALDWSRVIITLADERWVDAQDEASNERLVRAHLLQGAASAARFIGLKNDAATPFAGAAASEAALAAIPRPFDVVILGMGDDGHTASLFPGAENLFPALAMESGRLCMGMTPLTAPLDRITLTLPALLDSRHIYLHLVGDTKRQVYMQALGGAEVNEMPIRAVLQQSRTPVDVYWTA